MTHFSNLPSPRRDPTANHAVNRADKDHRDAVRAAAKAAEIFVNEVSKNNLYAVLMRGDNVISTTKLPEYGEVHITTHDNKVRFVEKREKEKVE